MSNIDNEENTFGPFEDLESQQYKKLYNTFDVPLMDVRKQHYSAFLITGLLILILIVVLSVSLKIPNYLKIPIEVENLEKDKVQMFNHSVKVNSFLARVGDTVVENQPICKITSPEIQSLISEIQSARSRLKFLKEFDSLDVALRIDNLNYETSNRENLLNVLAHERTATKERYLSKKKALISEVDYSRNFEQVNKKLYESGAVSKFTYMQIKQDLINKEDELTSLIKEFDQNMQQFNFKAKEIKGEIIETSNKQNELFSSFETEENSLKEQIDLGLNKLKLFYGDFKIEEDGLLLLSSNIGLLTFCYQSNNLLKPGEILYRLESSKGNFEGKGYISADKVGYVRTNLPSKVMLKTFPHYEWGNITGVVSKVSKSPNEQGSYTLNITFTEKNPKITPLLQNGQTGNSFILIEEKTLFGYLRRSVNKTADIILN